MGVTGCQPATSYSVGTSLNSINEQNSAVPLAVEPAETMPEVLVLRVVCQECGRQFASQRGLGVHRQRAHPVEYNRGIRLPRKLRWTDEERMVMAAEEVRALNSGVVFINQHLSHVFPHRTLEAIKKARQTEEYRALVREEQAARDVEGAHEDVEVSLVDRSVDGAVEVHPDASLLGPSIPEKIAELMGEVLMPGEGFHTEDLRHGLFEWKL